MLDLAQPITVVALALVRSGRYPMKRVEYPRATPLGQPTVDPGWQVKPALEEPKKRLPQNCLAKGGSDEGTTRLLQPGGWDEAAVSVGADRTAPSTFQGWITVGALGSSGGRRQARLSRHRHAGDFDPRGECLAASGVKLGGGISVGRREKTLPI